MKLHFIGIKGSGMSSLALIAKDLGYEVTGSDVDNFIFTQKALENAEINCLSFSKDNIQDNMTVVIGNSFDERNIEVVEALANPSVKTMRYYDFLSEVMGRQIAISVAGSHGKTTTTGMLKALLTPMKKTGYLIGDGTGKLAADDDVFVVESCEYKDTFLNYHPDYAVITNIDLDHVDYFKSLDQYIASFQTFVNQTKQGVVLCGDDENIKHIVTGDLRVLRYGFIEGNDVLAINVVEENHQTTFNLVIDGQDWGQVTLNFVGKHNVLNMLASIAMAHMLGESKAMILEHVNDFKGQHRRFIVEDYDDFIYIDDYAHHPTEIKVTIEAARARFKNHKIVLVYKPDRLSRAQYFENEFKEAMATADKAYMTHFYAGARAVEDIAYDIYDFQRALGDVAILSEDLQGAKILSNEGPAVYLFVSTKDVYLFKDMLKKIQIDKVLV